MYVKGDREASACPHNGSSLIGINIPLINTSGNLIIVDSIITVDVMLVGVEENIKPMAEKQNAESTIPRIRISGCMIVTPIAIPNNIGINEIATPKNTDARISPINIVVMETGQAARRSRFLDCVSVGATTGETDVEVKKTVIPSRPAIRKSIGRSLPTINAKKRNVGESTPNITTGPFR